MQRTYTISTNDEVMLISEPTAELFRAVTDLNLLWGDLAAALDRPDIFPADMFEKEIEPLLQAVKGKMGGYMLDIMAEYEFNKKQTL